MSHYLVYMRYPWNLYFKFLNLELMIELTIHKGVWSAVQPSYFPIVHCFFYIPRWLFTQQILIQHVLMETYCVRSSVLSHRHIRKWKRQRSLLSWTLHTSEERQTNYIAMKETQGGHGKGHWESDISKHIGHKRVSEADIQGKITALEVNSWCKGTGMRASSRGYMHMGNMCKVLRSLVIPLHRPSVG